MAEYEEFSVDASTQDERRGRGVLSDLLRDRPQVVRQKALTLVTALLASHRDGPDPVEPLVIRVISEPSALRIEVRDSGGGQVLNSLRGPTPGDPSGSWNPHLLSSEADRWGLGSGEHGTSVWFELELDSKRAT